MNHTEWAKVVAPVIPMILETSIRGFRPLPEPLGADAMTIALRRYLFRLAAAKRRGLVAGPPPAGARFSSAEELVIFNSAPIAANVLQMSVPASRAGACFHNAYMAALSHPARYRYAEGWALLEGSLPAHHAWLVDWDGNVQDPTWPAMYRGHMTRDPGRSWPGTAVYWGVTVDPEAHRIWTGRRGGVPNILNAHEVDVPEVLQLGLEALTKMAGKDEE